MPHAPTSPRAAGTSFVSRNPATESELWRSDGTAAGTHVVKDIQPGTGRSLPLALTAIDGMLYFTARDPVVGRQIRRTDGTAAGTMQVKDINQSTPAPLAASAVSTSVFDAAPRDAARPLENLVAQPAFIPPSPQSPGTILRPRGAFDSLTDPADALS
jgi:ELWxxDGT repeat protein